ncbi:4Fe-4S dicluster domain-containing protein [Bacillus benzoevorans]|uniref:MinD superfamily P-loop ATPase n=1 Tax=Bacillus benzoevorans TaxID=1456 RepID=A0A7X0HTR2_9BACI|nr:4Fe-4S dicluster domain-containing protein [Bacillus benzoevorans]MBB6446626.1 MinD superfamily P-loop ATPase [Bacillus benzoevorans]
MDKVKEKVADMGLFSSWAESLDYEYEILPSCTRHKSHYSACSKCVAACEKSAITIRNRKPVIDHSQCVQCGECMAACPVQGIAGILPKRKIIQGQLIVSEDQFPTTIELLIFYQKGIRSIICEDESFFQLCQERIEQVNEMLQCLGESSFSVSVHSVAEKDVCSRRELLSLWKKDSKSLMKEMTPAKWRFNQNSLNLRRYYPNYQFTKIIIDVEKCTLCKVCQRICEKKCFHIGDEHFSLSIKDCTACRLCADICPEKAIIFEEQIIKTEEIHFPIYEIVCQACQHPFKTLREEDETCPACTKLHIFEQNGVKES